MARGFSSFVAWRYLLARPRRASPAILGSAAFGVYVGLTFALGGLFYPLAEPYVLGPSLPISLLLMSAAGLAAVVVSGLAGVVHASAFARPRRMAPAFWHVAVMGLLFAAAPLPLRDRVTVGEGGIWPHVEELSHLAYLAPGAVALVCFAAAGVIASLRAVGLTYTVAGARALYAIAWGAALVQLLPLAVLALREELAPRVAEDGWNLWVVGPLGLLVVVLAAMAWLGARRFTGRATGDIHLVALLAIACAATPIAAVWILEGAGAWREAAGFGLRQPPMWMTMPTLIAWAVSALAAVLALVRYVFTFFTTVSIGGVCLGSMALVIVLSVMSGFETDLRDKILGADAHIRVTQRDDARPFTEYRQVGSAIEDISGVEAQGPYLESEVVISARNNHGNVIVKGVDPELVGEVTDLDENVGDPEALARLWPLAEDGSIAGPPEEREAARPDREPPEAGDDPRERPHTDPAPDDLQVDIDEPFDFSGAGGPEGADAAEDEGDEPVDPAPTDLEVGPDDPRDFSDPAPTDLEVGPDDPRDSSDPAPTDLEVGPDDPRDFSEPPPSDPIAPRPDELEGDDSPLWPGAQDEPDRDRDVEDPADISGFLGEALDDRLGESLSDPLAPAEFDDPIGIEPEVARLPGVLVGRELVDQVPVQAGDEVTLVSPLGQDSPLGPVPRTKRYRVAGEFFTGMYEVDLKYVYLPLYSLQNFLDAGDEVTGIEIRIDDPDRSAEVAAEIEDVIGSDYRVADWRELNRSLFAALQLEKIAMFIVLAIIILVASFSIVGNLVMIVMEKSKEIALLKTLGASDTGVMRIFVVQGVCIGVVGTALGLVLGLIVCALGMTYGLPLDPDVYYIDELPIHVDPVSVALVAVAGVAISAIATLYPAYVAARLRPVEGLRNE